MFNLKHLLQESKTRYLGMFANKRLPISRINPIISITFDDVPRTAMTNGVPILNRFDIKATFYVSMGLTESNTRKDRKNENEGAVFLTSTDIFDLQRSGHDICCHTYSHYMLNKGTAEGLVLDAKKNVHELCSLLNLTSIDHFAYPYGQVNLKAKMLLGKNYKTMRSSQPGINQKLTDMYILRAVGIYNPTFDKEKISNLINRLKQNGGWLIFYTHGVTCNPDAYSCTPDQFEWIIKQCKLSNARILTVSKAYTNIVLNS